ncbi:MAG TPA: hydrogen peroxide-dependent heme synthase [Gemmatimonadaceae bacterium]|nr:hydrogen peroxide-dependent heme synthase [Gemmatimonadaceae bacterium]
MTSTPTAHPPETLEGWYALHQVFRVNRQALDARPAIVARMGESAGEALKVGDAKPVTEKARGKRSATRESPGKGWSCFVRLIGSTADLMIIHFRDSLDSIAATQDALYKEDITAVLQPVYTFLSVTEAGLYHITAELARAATARGGAVGDEEYVRALAERSDAERASAHVVKRLYPELPREMPYVSFYPMSKRRDAGQNWYTLSLDERSRLMHAHGLTGRRYAGRVQQVITGAIGFDKWEWGVTLFAADPVEFKKLVTDMRFDEVSAKYAEFGDFYVGKVVEPAEWIGGPEREQAAERIGSLK